MTATIDALYDKHIDSIYAVFLEFTQHKGNKRYITHHTNAVPVAEKFVLKAIQSMSGSSSEGDEENSARDHLKTLTQSVNAQVELYNKLCKKYKEDQHEAKSRNKSAKLARREETSRAKDLEAIRREHSVTSTSASEAPNSSQPRATRSQTRQQSERSDELDSDQGRSDRGRKRVRISDEHTYHDDEQDHE